MGTVENTSLGRAGRASVPFKKSLGAKLLRYVFALYFIITITVTCLQMNSEYQRTKISTFSEMVNMEITFQDPIIKGVWEYSKDTLDRTLDAVLRVGAIAGAKVENDEGTLITTLKSHHTSQDRVDILPFTYPLAEKAIFNKIHFQGSSFLADLYEYKFPIVYRPKGTDEQDRLIGWGSLYTSEKAFIEKLQYGFSLIIINSLLKTFALWIIFTVMLKIFVTKPMDAFTYELEKIDINTPNESQVIVGLSQRTDELGVMARTFNSLMRSIDSHMGVIKDLNQNLEKKVVERTKDIGAMLENLEQGIFTFDENFKILGEYSVYLETIFEEQKLAGSDVFDFVFSRSNQSKNDLDQLKAAIFSSFHENTVQWEANAHLLLTEAILSFDGDRKKILEFAWQPITGEDEIITKVMVVIRDVTSTRALAAEAKAQAAELAKIGQLVHMGPEKFLDFYTRGQELLAENQKILINWKPNQTHIDTLYRNMHTLKGNSRTYKLHDIVTIVHEAESKYQDLQTNPEAWSTQVLESDIEEIRKEIDSYHAILTTKLGLVATEVKSAPSFERLSAMIAGEIASLDGIAKDLGKEPPHVAIHENCIHLPLSYKSRLKDIFTHLFRNHIDHGIEGPSERLAKGKPKQGKISMELSSGQAQINISIYDDGRGLNLGALAKNAQPGWGDQDIANLIFASGVSTAQKLSDISGRGVGMDAVKSFLEAMGGSIAIVFRGSKDDEGFRPFEFTITVPV